MICTCSVSFLLKFHDIKVTMLSDNFISTDSFINHVCQTFQLSKEEYIDYCRSHSFSIGQINLTPYHFVESKLGNTMFSRNKVMYDIQNINDTGDALAYVYLVQYFFS